VQILNFIVATLVMLGISLLIIVGVGILGGLFIDKVYKPFHQRYIVQPLFVDDKRCCR
jgi:ABC-type phosphate transport system permease subunit